jgi:uncharacterized membrane protein YphA (DoxX/SURF4 family)
MFDKKALQVYSVIIGIFFLVSGIGKAIDTTAFSLLIYQYGLGYSMILAPAIVVAEIMLGVSLVLLIHPRRDAWLSVIFLVVFTIAYAFAHFVHGVNDCGCFGTLKNPAVSGSPAFSFTRNLLLLIMSFIVWVKYPKGKPAPMRKWKRYLVLALFGISAFTAGFTFRTPFFLAAGNEKHPFQDRDIRETGLSKYLDASKDSTYLVFCFSYTCPHCWNSIENLRQFRDSHAVDRIVALSEGKEKDRQFFYESFQPDFPIRELTLDEMTALTDKMPTAFYIVHDTVKVIIPSALPSPVTFKKYYLEKNNP